MNDTTGAALSRDAQAEMSPTDQANDIQINILRRVPVDRATYYFLAITDATKFRKTLRRFAKSNVYLHSEAERPKRGTTTKSAMNLAFTLGGLRTLNVDEYTLASFPQPFRDGMSSCAHSLGDTGDSAPKYWDGALGSRNIHAIVALHGHEASRYQRDCRQIEANQAGKGYRILHTESGAALFDEDESGAPYRIEHFGFRDGISQPYVHLGGQRPMPGGGKPERDDGWAPIAPGEFILGYRDENEVVQPAPASDALRRNATYLVFRKLSQDVVGFRYFLTKQRTDPDQRELLAAQMVGRWRNGTPLVRSPNAPRVLEPASLNNF